MARGPNAFDSEVIPSFFGIRTTEDSRTSWNGEAFSNVYLRLGEVQAIIYPTDPRNRSGKLIEYAVLCEHRSNGTKVTRLYDGCLLMNMFGGLADYMMYTLRPQDNAGVNSAVANLAPLASGISTGSKVLLLCVNGEQHSPVIIGGIRQFADDDLLVLPQTTVLQGAFNGFKWQINDAGELILTYGGANNSSGFPRPPNPGPAVTGTVLQFSVDGSWSVTTGTKDQSITIDNTLKKIDINAFTQFNLVLGPAGQVNVTTATGPVTVSCQTITVGATQGVAIAGGSGGVALGNAPTDALLKGTTYRAAETALHTAMQAALQALAQAAQNAIPLGPAGAVPLATAVAAACQILVAALTAFEGGAQSYLSLLNKTD